jgi:hypothetical protein
MDEKIRFFIELLKKELEVSEQIAEWWEAWDVESNSPAVPHRGHKDEMARVYRKRAEEARRLIKQFSAPNDFSNPTSNEIAGSDPRIELPLAGRMKT